MDRIYRKLKVCGKRGHTVRISEPTKSKSGARVRQKQSKEFLNVTHTKTSPRVIVSRLTEAYMHPISSPTMKRLSQLPDTRFRTRSDEKSLAGLALMVLQVLVFVSHIFYISKDAIG